MSELTQRKRAQRYLARLGRCERKLARARDKLDKANRELKALRKLMPKPKKNKTIDGVFSVVGLTSIEQKG
jgi:hypothetical protein